MQDRLTRHGIHNEQSDLRLHVCPVVRKVYVFPVTDEAIRRIERSPERSASRLGDLTARGHVVPWDDLPKCVEIGFTDRLWELSADDPRPDLADLAYPGIPGDEDGGTYPAGRWAGRFAKRLLEWGMIPLPDQLGFKAIVSTLEQDLEGVDLILRIRTADD